MNIVEMDAVTKVFPKGGKRRSWMTRVGQALRLREKDWLFALDEVDLRIEKGEVFGVLGPNGAGKTTLLKLVAGLLIPDGGRCVVNGYDVIENRHEVRTSCGFLRSGGWVVLDYKYPLDKLIEFWGIFMGLSRKEVRERLPIVIEKVGLRDKITAFTEDLSAGERQRANIARCLIAPRPIYLLDEPTVHVDAMSADSIRRIVKEEMIQDGATAILATHNIREAEILCDKIAILDRGQILMIDSPKGLKKRIGHECAILNLRSCPDDLLKALDSKDYVTSLMHKHRTVRIYGRDLRRNLTEIIDLCRKHSEIDFVDIVEPTLTDIFVQIIVDRNRSQYNQTRFPAR